MGSDGAFLVGCFILVGSGFAIASLSVDQECFTGKFSLDTGGGITCMATRLGLAGSCIVGAGGLLLSVLALRGHKPFAWSEEFQSTLARRLVFPIGFVVVWLVFLTVALWLALSFASEFSDLADAVEGEAPQGAEAQNLFPEVQARQEQVKILTVAALTPLAVFVAYWAWLSAVFVVNFVVDAGGPGTTGGDSHADRLNTELELERTRTQIAAEERKNAELKAEERRLAALKCELELARIRLDEIREDNRNLASAQAVDVLHEAELDSQQKHTVVNLT